MTGTAVVTDSSAQLPAALADRLGITVVPIGICIGQQDHPEPELDIDAFYDLLSRGESVSTSLPSPGRMAEAYREAAGRSASGVVSIHLDGRVSGTVGSARLAAEDVPVTVAVVDTGTVGFGVGVCVLAAARAAASGQRLREIESLVVRLAPAIENVFVADAPATGRVAGGGKLSLLSFVDGTARLLDPCDDLEHAAAAMADRIPADRPLRTAVGHGHDVTAVAAGHLVRRLEDMPNVADVLRYRVSPSIAAHTGPRSFGAFWWPA